MRLGLRLRLTLVMALSLAALGAIAVVGWSAYQRAFDSIVRSNLETIKEIGNESLSRQGRATARLLAEQLANPVYFLDLSTIGRITRAAVEQGDVAYVIVFDVGGNVLHDGTDDIGTFGQAMNDEFTVRANTAAGTLVQTSERLIDITQPLMLGRERIGGVRVGMSRTPSRAALDAVESDLFERVHAVDRGTRLRIAWPLLGVLFLTGAIAFLALRKVVQPLRELADHAREIEQGRFSIVIDRKRRDEIGDLQQAFARMSRSLGDYDRQIRALAYRDALTGLGNRLALHDSLPLVLERSRAGRSRAALLFVDLDDFKRINDTLGHESGDRVLVQVAERIVRARDETRAEDVTDTQAEDELVARFGGDEFVVVLLGNDVRERARRMAQLTLDLLRLPLMT
ncbi:MAG: diguanylate cyclase, partial [Lysobacterales bacterium]